MRTWLLAALVACSDPLPEAYECSGSLACNGETYPIEPQRACFDSPEAAAADWRRVTEALADLVACDYAELYLVCEPTGIPCA